MSKFKYRKLDNFIFYKVGKKKTILRGVFLLRTIAKVEKRLQFASFLTLKALTLTFKQSLKYLKFFCYIYKQFIINYFYIIFLFYLKNIKNLLFCINAYLYMKKVVKTYFNLN